MSQQKANEIWQKAQTHRKACQVGYPSESQPFELCECCDQFVHTQPISMGAHTKQLQIYGFGYPLWFSFLKHCMLLVFVLIVTRTAAEIVTATDKNYEFCYGGQQNQLNQTAVKEAKEKVKDKVDKVKSEGNKAKKSHRLMELSHHHLGFLEQKEQDFITPTENFKNLRHFQLLKSNNNNNDDDDYNHQHLFTASGATHYADQSQEGVSSPCTSYLVYLAFFQQNTFIDNWFLNIVEFIAHLVTLIYFRNSILKEQQYFDQRTCSSSDYTIVVSNLPKSHGTRRSIERMFKYQFGKDYGSRDSSIQDIIFVFQDDELTKLSKKIDQSQKDVLKAEKKQDSREVKKAQEQMKKSQEQLEKKARQVRKRIANDEVQCDKVIMIMSYEYDKAQVLQKFTQDKYKSYKKYFDGESKDEILIKQCHQPNELIWQNIDDSERNRKCRQFAGWIFTFVFLAASTCIYYLIIKAKTKLIVESVERQSEKSRLPEILKAIAVSIVLIVSVGVVMFNKFVLGRIIKLIVSMEKHGYVDKQSISFASKYAMAMFFTTALMILIVQAFSFNNIYQHHLGFIEQISTMFFVTSLLVPLIWVIHPYNMIKKFKRDRIYGTLVLQKEANAAIQDYPYDMGKRYAEIYKLLWFTFLYAEVVPIGSFLCFLSIILYYWIDKYNFIHNVSTKPGLSGKSAIVALKAVDATLFLTPTGQFIFDLILNANINIMALIFIIIGLVYLLLPITSFIWKYNDEKFNLQDRPYSQVVDSFRQTYISLHPVYRLTHKKELEQHKNRIRRHYQEQMKRAKYYGAGRGKYHKQTSALQKKESKFSSKGQ